MLSSSVCWDKNWPKLLAKIADINGMTLHISNDAPVRNDLSAGEMLQLRAGSKADPAAAGSDWNSLSRWYSRFMMRRCSDGWNVAITPKAKIGFPAAFMRSSGRIVIDGSRLPAAPAQLNLKDSTHLTALSRLHGSFIHEAAHAVHSPEFDQKLPLLTRTAMGILDDIRIEKQWLNKHPQDAVWLRAGLNDNIESSLAFSVGNYPAFNAVAMATLIQGRAISGLITQPQADALNPTEAKLDKTATTELAELWSETVNLADEDIERLTELAQRLLTIAGVSGYDSEKPEYKKPDLATADSKDKSKDNEGADPNQTAIERELSTAIKKEISELEFDNPLASPKELAELLKEAGEDAFKRFDEENLDPAEFLDRALDSVQQQLAADDSIADPAKNVRDKMEELLEQAISDIENQKLADSAETNTDQVDQQAAERQATKEIIEGINKEVREAFQNDPLATPQELAQSLKEAGEKALDRFDNQAMDPSELLDRALDKAQEEFAKSEEIADSDQQARQKMEEKLTEAAKQLEKMQAQDKKDPSDSKNAVEKTISEGIRQQVKNDRTSNPDDSLQETADKLAEAGKDALDRFEKEAIDPSESLDRALDKAVDEQQKLNPEQSEQEAKGEVSKQAQEQLEQAKQQIEQSQETQSKAEQGGTGEPEEWDSKDGGEDSEGGNPASGAPEKCDAGGSNPGGDAPGDGPGESQSGGQDGQPGDGQGQGQMQPGDESGQGQNPLGDILPDGFDPQSLGDVTEQLGQSLEEMLQQELLESDLDQELKDLQEAKDIVDGNEEWEKSQAQGGEGGTGGSDDDDADSRYTSTGGSSGRAISWKERPATGEERSARNQLTALLRRARWRDRDVTRIQTKLPPGRLRTRGLLQEIAQKERGGITTAKPWVTKKRKLVEQPKLRAGILIDTSGSMAAATGGLASALWILANSIHDVEGITAAAGFGDSVKLLYKTGKPPKKVFSFKANGGTENIHDGLKKVDNELKLMEDREGPRLIVIVSDGYWTGRETQRAGEYLKKMQKAGIKVILINIGSPPLKNHPHDEMCTIDKPKDLAKVVGKAALRALKPEEAK